MHPADNHPLLHTHTHTHRPHRHIPKVALGFDLTVFPLTILFMLAMYFLTWRALKGPRGVD